MTIYSFRTQVDHDKGNGSMVLDYAVLKNDLENITSIDVQDTSKVSVEQPEDYF